MNSPDLRSPANVVCIGGGLWFEIAGAIAKHGLHVTVLEALDWLLPRQLEKKVELLRKQIEWNFTRPNEDHHWSASKVEGAELVGESPEKNPPVVFKQNWS